MDSERRPLADLEVKVLTVLTEGFGVDSSNVDLTLVLLSDRLECLDQSLALLDSLGENVRKGNASLQSDISIAI